MDYFHFRMGKTADFPVPEKYVRLVLLGASDFTFCSCFTFCSRAEIKKKPVANIINNILQHSYAGFSDSSCDRNRKW